MVFSDSELDSETCPSSFASTPRSLHGNDFHNTQLPVRKLPALNLPPLQLGGGHARAPVRQRPEAPRSGPAQRRWNVISPAFTLDSDSVAESREACSRRLGVEPSRLQFLKLVPVDTEEAVLDKGCLDLGITIKDSRLSLDEIERLMEEAAAGSSRSEEGQAREPAGNVPTEGRMLGNLADEMEALWQQVARLESENCELKHKVKHLEGMRRRGQVALRDIKREFDSLCGDLLCLPGGDGRQHSASTTPVALTHGLIDSTQ